jgi:NAD(P)-dependent dehydrogenase (short-subunit alcohol dehydrogenase family)
MEAGLQARHAVVTGGGSGIGAAIAHALAEQGARVTLMGRTRARLEEQAKRLASLTEVQPIEVDITAPESVARGFAQASDRFGSPSILVNNAGQAAAAPFLEIEVSSLWKQMLDVNLTGTFLCTKAALRGMIEQRYGRIVNVASTAGLAGYRYVAAYCAAKHGVIGLTRALALEVAKKNITVNAVCPGYTDTDIVSTAAANIGAKTGRTEAEAREELARTNPQGRLVKPEEVANAVLWLCLPGAEAITGQAISVSGGEVT